MIRFITVGTPLFAWAFGCLLLAPSLASAQTIDEPADLTVNEGEVINFSVTPSSTATYQWQRNDSDIPGEVSATYTIASASFDDNGAQFRVVATDNGTTIFGREAILTVNSLPVPQIAGPDDGGLYKAGETILFSGSAVDAEDGALAAAALTWEVRSIDGSNVQTVVGPLSGVTGGSFVVPSTGASAINVSYEIRLTATDSRGATRTTTSTITPSLTSIRLDSNLTASQVVLDGSTVDSPYNLGSVVNLAHSLSTLSSRVVNGITYQFDHWTNSKIATFSFPTAGIARTYRAYYRAANRLVSLSDMPWEAASDGSVQGVPHRDTSTGGGAMRLNGVASAKGVGVQSSSEIRIALDESYSTFQSDVGIDDEVATGASVTFQVWADDDKIFDSGAMTASSATRHVVCNLRGKTQLRLVTVDNGADPAAAHANWAAARLTLAPFLGSFAQFSGSYTGSIASADFARAGLAKIVLNAPGTFSASVRLGAKTYLVSGTLDQRGHFSGGIGSTGLSLSLDLDLDNGTDQITGTISSSAFVSNFTLDRQLFDPVTNPATQYAGRYTILFPRLWEQAELPQGDGYGTVTIDRAGFVRLNGVLCDGTRITQGARLSKNGSFPLAALAYGAKGGLWGEVSFADLANESDFRGDLKWFKPATPDAPLYPGEISTSLTVIGSKYIAPPAGTRVLDLADAPANAEIDFAGGNLSAGLIQKNFTLRTDNRAVFASDAGATLSISTATGRFTGTFLDADTGTVRSFSGAIFQKQNFGAGLFRTPAAIGHTEIVPVN